MEWKDVFLSYPCMKGCFLELGKAWAVPWKSDPFGTQIELFQQQRSVCSWLAPPFCRWSVRSVVRVCVQIYMLRVMESEGVQN